MRMLIGGDFCPENRAEQLLRNGQSIFSQEFQELWDSTDFRILNLEGPITDNLNKIIKVGRHIKFSPSIMSGLARMGVTHFSLANNHIMDYGKYGLKDTVKYLQDNNIDFFGIHSNPYTIIEKDNIKVALLSFSNKEFSIIEDNNGVGAFSIDIIDILKQIERVKQITSNIVIILHTGLSKYPLPSPEQRKLCRFLIDNGVGAVLCQHSHIIGAYEHYNSGFISYGQGSFVFELNRSKSIWNQGYCILLSFKDDENSVSVIPHKQFDDTLNIRTLTHQEYTEFNNSLETENKALNDHELFQAAWHNYLNKVEKYYFNQFFLPRNRAVRKLLNTFNFKKMLSDKNRALLLNNLRNDEHLEVIRDLLKRD